MRRNKGDVCQKRFEKRREKQLISKTCNMHNTIITQKDIVRDIANIKEKVSRVASICTDPILWTTFL